MSHPSWPNSDSSLEILKRPNLLNYGYWRRSACFICSQLSRFRGISRFVTTHRRKIGSTGRFKTSPRLSRSALRIAFRGCERRQCVDSIALTGRAFRFNYWRGLGFLVWRIWCRLRQDGGRKDRLLRKFVWLQVLSKTLQICIDCLLTTRSEPYWLTHN